MKIKVENMRSPRTGNGVANQFIVRTDKGTYFQSYCTVIAFKPYSGKIQLDPNYDCSVTTGKYRNEFLGEGIADTRNKIKSGEYIIKNLN